MCSLHCTMFRYPIACAMFAASWILLFIPASGRTAVIEEIVVTARAAEESVRNIPVAITAISEDRLQKLALHSMLDLEAVTPQLAIGRGSSGSGASIAIRGIGSTFTSIGIEQSVAVIIDGVYFPQGRAINEGLFDVSQVAVLKGPQALYFGKNATAGVISVQTNDPGDELEASFRINNEFESRDRTVEGIISFPLNDKFGLRLAVQASEMRGGWIRNNAPASGDIYTTIDGFTGDINTFENPKAANIWPREETLYARLTAAGDLGDRFSYNLKGTYSSFEQNSPTGGGELFDCPTLGGVAHISVLAPDQPPGRPTPLFVPQPLPTVDCQFSGARGINDVPPQVAATNRLLNEFGGGRSGEKYESWSLTGTFDWALDKVDLRSIINYHDQDLWWVGDQDGGEVTSIFAGEYNTFENFSAEIRAVTRLDQPLNFVLGAYYQTTDRFFNQVVNFGNVQWSGPTNGGTVPFDPRNEFTAYDKLSGTDGETRSLYGEVIWDIADRWQLTAGVRYLHETKDSYFFQPYVAPYSFFPIFFTQFDPDDPSTIIRNDQRFEDLVPEATLRWEATDDLTLYIAYKEGFKSGGFSNSAILGNISGSVSDFSFDPEKVRGGEIGAKAALFDNSMLATFEVYYYKFTDLQVDFFNSQQFAYVTENAGGSETYGAELQITWATPVDGLTLSGSISRLESLFTDFESFCFVGQTPAQGCTLLPGQNEADVRQNLKGNRRPGAPRWSGDMAIDFERPIGSQLMWGFTANMQYTGETGLIATDPTATYESYVTFDANVRIGTADGRWRLSFIGKNLTDEEAIRGAGPAPGTGGNTGTTEGFRGDLTGAAIRPRQLELELTWRY